MATYGECVDCDDPIKTSGQDWCDSCLGLKFSAEGKFGNNENPAALDKEEREKVQEIVTRVIQEIPTTNHNHYSLMILLCFCLINYVM